MGESKNDNIGLFELQEKFKNGDDSALGFMYLQCRRIALRMISSERMKKGFYLSNLEAKEKAHNAAVYIVLRYKKKSDFVIKKSFTAYIRLRVLHELYHMRKVDGIIDFINLEEFYNGS